MVRDIHDSRVCWGMNTVLVRDLTDTMYNPARPPWTLPMPKEPDYWWN